jgi:hypothetical protein
LSRKLQLICNYKRHCGDLCLREFRRVHHIETPEVHVLPLCFKLKHDCQEHCQTITTALLPVENLNV